MTIRNTFLPQPQTSIQSLQREIKVSSLLRRVFSFLNTTLRWRHMNNHTIVNFRNPRREEICIPRTVNWRVNKGAQQRHVTMNTTQVRIASTTTHDYVSTLCHAEYDDDIPRRNHDVNGRPTNGLLSVNTPRNRSIRRRDVLLRRHENRQPTYLWWNCDDVLSSKQNATVYSDAMWINNRHFSDATATTYIFDV